MKKTPYLAIGILSLGLLAAPAAASDFGNRHGSPSLSDAAGIVMTPPKVVIGATIGAVSEVAGGLLELPETVIGWVPLPDLDEGFALRQEAPRRYRLK